MVLCEGIFERRMHSYVKYLDIDGAAAALSGYVRAAADVDLLISLEVENIEKHIEAVKRLGMVPRLPLQLKDFTDKEKRTEWFKEENMMVFLCINLITRLDKNNKQKSSR